VCSKDTFTLVSRAHILLLLDRARARRDRGWVGPPTLSVSGRSELELFHRPPEGCVRIGLEARSLSSQQGRPPASDRVGWVTTTALELQCVRRPPPDAQPTRAELTIIVAGLLAAHVGPVDCCVVRLAIAVVVVVSLR
jgi:hypothetical protein